jgi:hypothetical protein
MLGDEQLELAKELRMVTERQVGLDPSFERRPPEVLQASCLSSRESLLTEVGQWRPAPEGERFA